VAKASFNAESEHIRGFGAVALRGLALYYGTEEAAEGRSVIRAAREQLPSSELGLRAWFCLHLMPM
jgi:1,4-dihydroxy-2-naphthoyl-CoA synthase